MFYHTEGKVAEIAHNLAVVDCFGAGFALNVSSNTLSRLKIGEKAKLYTYSYIREDAFDLYGFHDKREKNCFEMLIAVSGVGPKAALSILSSSTPESLALAIIGGDERVLTMAQGIGKKIAQRIILELKDKMGKETDGIAAGLSKGFSSSAAGSKSKLSDAASALAVLGYSNAEIGAALADIDIENTALEDIIKQALKKMMK